MDSLYSTADLDYFRQYTLDLNSVKLNAGTAPVVRAVAVDPAVDYYRTYLGERSP